MNSQPANKLDVLQSLMVHDILVKRKSILDQFRKGLCTLGLLKEMEKNPHLFEECFIHKGKMTQESVANCLHFEDSEDADSERVFQMLQSFVRNVLFETWRICLNSSPALILHQVLLCITVFPCLVLTPIAFLLPAGLRSRNQLLVDPRV